MGVTATYTGGIHGWGTMLYRCEFCGRELAEYEVDEAGKPTEAIFDYGECDCLSVEDNDEE